MKRPKALQQSFTVFKTHCPHLPSDEEPWRGGPWSPERFSSWLKNTQHRLTSSLIFSPVPLASQQEKHFQRKLPTPARLPKTQFGHHLGPWRGRNGHMSPEAFTPSWNKVETKNGSMSLKTHWHVQPGKFFFPCKFVIPPQEEGAAVVTTCFSPILTNYCKELEDRTAVALTTAVVASAYHMPGTARGTLNSFICILQIRQPTHSG